MTDWLDISQGRPAGEVKRDEVVEILLTEIKAGAPENILRILANNIWAEARCFEEEMWLNQIPSTEDMGR